MVTWSCYFRIFERPIPPKPRWIPYPSAIGPYPSLSQKIVGLLFQHQGYTQRSWGSTCVIHWYHPLHHQTLFLCSTSSSALEMLGLESLYNRRQKRCIDFALKSVKHSRTRKMFPLNQIEHEHNIREKEIFKVNFERTEQYRKSAIPHC